jgi:hypothetical protein
MYQKCSTLLPIFKKLNSLQDVEHTSFFEAIKDCFKTIQYIKVLGVKHKLKSIVSL